MHIYFKFQIHKNISSKMVAFHSFHTYISLCIIYSLFQMKIKKKKKSRDSREMKEMKEKQYNFVNVYGVLIDIIQLFNLHTVHSIWIIVKRCAHESWFVEQSHAEKSHLLMDAWLTNGAISKLSHIHLQWMWSHSFCHALEDWYDIFAVEGSCATFENIPLGHVAWFEYRFYSF